MFGRKRFSAKEYVDYRKYIQKQIREGKLKVPATPLTDSEKIVILY